MESANAGSFRVIVVVSRFRINGGMLLYGGFLGKVEEANRPSERIVAQKNSFRSLKENLDV